MIDDSDFKGSSSQPRNARTKIVSVAEMAALAKTFRAQGLKVVLAHGVFDLLHMGHVRHLEMGRRQGSVLLVTVTADAYVNKGPDRPVFPEQLRAEMLGSLEYVDAVSVNNAASAEDLIRRVRPDVYLKGGDYIAEEEDITGKISSERDAVEEHGGSVIYTDDITFSSSECINRYLNVYDPSLQQYLDGLREGNALERLLGILDKVSDYKVLVIGDSIIDEYKYVTALGKPPKENVIATLYRETEIFAGGVFAAANHAASFCKQVDVLTSLGTIDSYEETIRASLKPNVRMQAIYRADTPTTRKTRYVDPGYSMRKLFEVYHMDDRPLMADRKRQFDTIIEEKIGDYDVVIVTDFGHGLLSRDSASVIEKHARYLGINTQSNAGNLGFNLIGKYDRADYVCIDQPEARLAVADKYSDIEHVIRSELPRVIDCENAVITMGKHGSMSRDKDGKIERMPALTSTVVDTVGAGDAFFAVTTPIAASGASLKDTCFLGNVAGAMKVGIVGHRSSVDRIPFVKFLTALLK